MASKSRVFAHPQQKFTVEKTASVEEQGPSNTHLTLTFGPEQTSLPWSSVAPCCSPLHQVSLVSSSSPLAPRLSITLPGAPPDLPTFPRWLTLGNSHASFQTRLESPRILWLTPVASHPNACHRLDLCTDISLLHEAMRLWRLGSPLTDEVPVPSTEPGTSTLPC